MGWDRRASVRSIFRVSGSMVAMWGAEEQARTCSKGTGVAARRAFLRAARVSFWRPLILPSVIGLYPCNGHSYVCVRLGESRRVRVCVYACARSFLPFEHKRAHFAIKTL